jgi:glycerol uptake facilitator-like aquaporin
VGSELSKKLLAEFIGSHFLVVAAISPTILGYNVLGAGIPLTVFIDAMAVGFVLFALIEALGPISGCHINPAVTLSFMATRRMGVKEGSLYMTVQFIGGFTGAISSHLMFYHAVPTVITVSAICRPAGCYYAEFLGTFLLVLTISLCLKNESKLTGLVVGLLVGGFIITTSSTMFANPQVTIARVFTYSIAGICPADATPFMLAEIIGALVATLVACLLFTPKGAPTTLTDIRSVAASDPERKNR